MKITNEEGGKEEKVSSSSTGSDSLRKEMTHFALISNKALSSSSIPIASFEGVDLAPFDPGV